MTPGENLFETRFFYAGDFIEHNDESDHESTNSDNDSDSD